MFDVNAILQKADLLEYVEKAGATPRRSGTRYVCACPLHGGENPTAFSIFQSNGKLLWHCFTDDCGTGDAIKFVELWQFPHVANRAERFKLACKWIDGNLIADPESLRKSAEERLRREEQNMRKARARELARRRELQLAERHVYYHKTRADWAKKMWAEKGIDEGMQEFWTLGSCDDFVIDDGYHTPTLTIPVFDEQRQLLTIRHKLVKPRTPKDKYRPERSGLRSHPWLAVPEMGYDGGLIWVMEGEIKAAVTWTISDTDWQCIGVPGQQMFAQLVDKLNGKNFIVVPDPGAEKKAFALARAAGGRVLILPDKIDDLLLGIQADQNVLYALSKQARRLT